MTASECIIEIRANKAVPPAALANWRLMQEVIQKHNEEMHAGNMQAVATNIQQENKRLYKQWKRNRTVFASELLTWFCKPII